MTQHNMRQAGNNLTLVGVFSTRQHVENALIGLSSAGFKPDVISVLEKELAPTQEAGREFEGENIRQASSPTFLRLVLVGAIYGGLIAGGVTFIGGLWSIRAFELMEATLAGAIIGASIGAVVVGFNKLGLLQSQPEGSGENQINSAYARVSFNVPDEKTLEEVKGILVRNGAYGTRFYKRPAPLPVVRGRF